MSALVGHPLTICRVLYLVLIMRKTYNLTPEGLAKKRNGLKKLRGVPKSPEHRAKIGAANKGRNNPWNERNLHSKDIVIERLRSIYSGRYRLRDFDYRGYENTKIILVCPMHGDFEKRLSDAVYSKTGCPKCSGFLSTEEKYEQMISNYPHYTFKVIDKVYAFTQITATCNLHKVKFCFSSSRFLKATQVHLCPKCADEERNRRAYSTKLSNYTPDAAGYRAYRQIVRRETTRWLRLAGKNHLRTRSNHIDHMYSIADGWKHGVQPEIVGHLANLRFLDSKSNQSKSSSSSITKKQLLNRYRKYRRE